MGLITPSFLLGHVQKHRSIGAYIIPPNVTATQIHWTKGHHVVSHQNNCSLAVYDSLQSPRRIHEMSTDLSILYEAVEKGVIPLHAVKYIIPQRQGTTLDCGIFGAANAVLLVHNVKPEDVVLDQKLLRQHLYHCIVDEVVELFPMRLWPTHANKNAITSTCVGLTSSGAVVLIEN